MCQVKIMKAFVEANQCHLPDEYFHWNSTLNVSHSLSHIQYVFWHERQLISVDYLQCITSSMELFNHFDVLWSDKSSVSQSFESYVLRSIYNVPELTSVLRTLAISRMDLSLNGLVMLLTRLPVLVDLVLSDGKIDQMGAAMCDTQRMINTHSNEVHSGIQTMVMSNICMSRRTAVNLCLITRRLVSLTMNEVKLMDKMNVVEENLNHDSSGVLVLLKQIAQCTDQFRWSTLKSLTLGKRSERSSLTHLRYPTGSKPSPIVLIMHKWSNIFFSSQVKTWSTGAIWKHSLRRQSISLTRLTSNIFVWSFPIKRCFSLTITFANPFGSSFSFTRT